MKLVRACPVCDGRKAEFLLMMNFAAETNCILPAHHQIVACNKCGCIYNNVDARDELFENYYRNCAKYVSLGVGGAGELSIIDRIRYQSLLNFLSPFVSPQMTIADIGCGKGGWLRFLHENGFRQITGIEPSAGCVEIIRHQFQLEAICSDIKSLNSDRQFNLVILSNVLEHIFDLRTAVRKISGVVAPKGLIAIEVPDASRYASFPHAPYYYFDMEHINHFDLKSMKNVWFQAGFEVLAEEATTCFPVEGMENPICRLLVRKKEPPKSLSFPHSDTATYLRQYIEWSQKKAQTLPEAPENQQRFFLWGCGAYAKWFLQNKLSALPAGIVEINRRKVGRSVNGCPIISPEMLMAQNSEKEIIMISSVLYEQQICKQLKDLQWRGKILSACRPREEQEY